MRGLFTYSTGLNSTAGLSWMSAHFVWWPFSPIGFVIASVGLTNGILTGDVYTTLVAVTCITVVITPFFLRKSYEAEGFMERLGRFYDRLSKQKKEQFFRRLRK